MNTYKKYCPNVFVAKCQDEHEKGDSVILTTRHGKENNCIIHNFLGKDKDGSFLYSFTRSDGFNSQERAKAKAEKYQSWGNSARQKSNEFYQKSHEATKHIPMGQPILVGHHSERRHRRDLDRSWSAMGKSVEMGEKAEEHESKADYWARMSTKIDLSMPESIEFFEFKLQKANELHKFYIDNPDKRKHSYSLTYAKKEVNELIKKVALARKLWA